MNKIASRVKMAAAATAIAGAAALVQAPVAQAAPVVPAPEAVGNFLGLSCVLGVGEDCANTPGTEFEGSGFYLGPRDTTPPARTDIFVFRPAVLLGLVPVIGPVVAGWFNSLNLEVCVGGASARIGPYGSVSASVGAGC